MLLLLGLWGSYTKDPNQFFLNVSYIVFIIVVFLVVRYFIRRYKQQKNLTTNIQAGSEDVRYASNLPLPIMNSGVVIGQTPQSRLLWAALKERGVECKTEHFDGHKTIDIAVIPAKLYIEVDGMQHFKDMAQVMADLKRDDYSDREGFRTIRISNSAIEHNINSIADEIARQARERQQYFSPSK